jgi:hypothetical protein
MSIRTLDSDLNIISALPDEPTDAEGMSAAQVKAKFDESGNLIQGYINETLIPDIGDELVRVEAEITASVTAAELQSGNVPTAGATGQVLRKNSGNNYDFGWQTITGSSAPTPGTLMQRDGNGRAQVAEPVEVGDAATKGYVDNMDPIGTIKHTLQTNLGPKWLLCNGAGVAQSSYPDLYPLLKDCIEGSDYIARAVGGGWGFCYGNGYYVFYGYSGGNNLVFWTTDPVNGTWSNYIMNLSGFFAPENGTMSFLNGYFIWGGKVNTGQAAGFAYCTNPSSTGNWSSSGYIRSGTNITCKQVVRSGSNYVAHVYDSNNAITYFYRFSSLGGAYTQSYSSPQQYTANNLTVCNGYILCSIYVPTYRYMGVFNSAGEEISATSIGGSQYESYTSFAYINNIYYATTYYNYNSKTIANISYNTGADPSVAANWKSSILCNDDNPRGICYYDPYYIVLTDNGAYIAADAISGFFKKVALPISGLQFMTKLNATDKFLLANGSSYILGAAKHLPLMEPVSRCAYIKAFP